MVDKELIENWRNMVKPSISSLLFKTNYEGMGEQDKEEFERDFDEILDLALIGLKHKAQLSQEDTESLCKKVRALCEESKIEFFFVGGGESTWSVTNDKHIKKIVECHKAQLSQEGTTKDATPDTISRQAAIDALQKEINKGIPPFDDVMGSIRCGVRLARNIIEDLPSAQPEIIRCKDCKHWDGVDTCDVIDAPVWDNDFCSMAERRSNE